MNLTSFNSINISCVAKYRPGHILGPWPNGREANGWISFSFLSRSHRCGWYVFGATKYCSFNDVTELNADTSVYKALFLIIIIHKRIGDKIYFIHIFHIIQSKVLVNTSEFLSTQQDMLYTIIVRECLHEYWYYLNLYFFFFWKLQYVKYFTLYLFNFMWKWILLWQTFCKNINLYQNTDLSKFQRYYLCTPDSI